MLAGSGLPSRTEGERAGGDTMRQNRASMPELVASSRAQKLRPTAVNAILGEVRRLEAQGRKVVSLMRGEPDMATPPHIVAAAERALAHRRTHYPDNRGEPALREAVAAKLERDNGLRYDPSGEILVTTGATMGIYLALMALLEEGDHVLLPEPIYDAYASPIRLAGGVPRFVAARIEQGRFSIAVDDLEAAWNPSCRVLIVNTPWNPTGTVLRRAELEALADFACRRGVALVVDEIYEALLYDGRAHLSMAALSEPVRERTVLVNSLSKTYAMTGWRVGYCAGPRAIIEAMLVVLQQSSRGPATFVQDAAVEALLGPQDCVAQMREEYARRRARLLEVLADVPRCRALAPEGGFFAMLDVRGLGLKSDEVRRTLLEEDGVAVVHGAAYGPSGEGMLRVSFGSGGQRLEEGLARLKQGLARQAERVAAA